jgi:excisionase family DNA binding protein
MTTDCLVKVSEAARAVGLSKFTLYKAAKAGKVPFYKQGKALRFSVAEVREAMRQAAGEK